MPRFRSLSAAPLAVAAAIAASPAGAESVRFDTSFGAFDVNLFEEDAPGHVANFLAYVDAGDYDNSIFHRAAETGDGGEFVAQGGAFRFEGTAVETPFDLADVTNRGAIDNEFGASNTRGTLALARVGGQENSGSNQFFFNLQDNPFLDDVDGGFTVFGEVEGEAGLSILDQIAAVPTFASDVPFGELPLRNFAPEIGDVPSVGADEFVLVNSIVRVVIDDGDGTDPTNPGDGDGDDGDGDGDGNLSPVDPTPIPTPGAALAGLLGLTAVSLRRKAVDRG